MQKYLLCRPQNGFNDILNQIEICCRYAEQHGRRVIVDTGYRHTMYFKESFSNYFISRQPVLSLDNPLSDSELDRLDVYPRFLAGRVSSYETDWRRLIEFRFAWRPLAKAGRFVDKASGRPIWFSFHKDYRHTILVHSQGGGGTKSFDCLSRLQAQPWLVDRLEQRLSQMPRAFAAIHIRHTDLTTDYASILTDLREQQISALFVATDNRTVLEDFKEALPATQLFSFTALPDRAGAPMHKAMPIDEAPQRNTDTILDLLTLAFANPLLLARTREAMSSTKLSGFSQLATELNQNPAALMKLLGERKSLLGRLANTPANQIQQPLDTL